MEKTTNKAATTELHRNPFCMLGVSMRDDRSKIVEMAEERSLYIDAEACQKARADLINPRARLTAELSWMPGVAPRVTEDLIRALTEQTLTLGAYERLAPLPKANVMAAAGALMNGFEPVERVATFIWEFARTVEAVELERVMLDINADRTIAGFPEVSDFHALEEVWSRHFKSYRTSLKDMLERMAPDALVEALTRAVKRATDDGMQQAPLLIDELVDAFEVEAQSFLEAEAKNLDALAAKALADAKGGLAAIRPTLDRLEQVARNWTSVAKPIQLSARSRGTSHPSSEEVAYGLRSLGVTLNNDHGLLDGADRMTRLLGELFIDLGEFGDKLAQDAEAIRGLREDARAKQSRDAQWEREIAFDAEVGLMFKDRLTVSAKGIGWKERLYPLDSIRHVRWGGVRRSVNGVPTGTDYTVAFSLGTSHQVIALRKESTYTALTRAMWRAVCVRLIIEMLSDLERGKSLRFGDLVIEDSAVTLPQHRFWGNSSPLRLRWADVHAWSSDGKFVIGKRDDKKVFGSASYIQDWDTHLIEHVVSGAFKMRVAKLSDYLKS